jgi:ribonuclease P protein component
VPRFSPDPSEAPKSRSDARSEPIARLTRREEFLNAAKGKRCHTAAFTLQCAASVSTAPKRCSDSTMRPEVDLVSKPHYFLGIPPRVGITITKKIGSAVTRNRIRRRFKEALRWLSPLPASRGHDYVIVARREALGMPFPMLIESLSKAFIRVTKPSGNTGAAQVVADARSQGSCTAQGTRESRPLVDKAGKDRTGKAPNE